jgi:Tfp pilus assembly protein PilF
MYNRSIPTYKNRVVATWQPNDEHYLNKLRRKLNSKTQFESSILKSYRHISLRHDIDQSIIYARNKCSMKDDNDDTLLECKVAWDIVEEMSAAMYDMKLKENYYRDD